MGPALGSKRRFSFGAFTDALNWTCPGEIRRRQAKSSLRSIPFPESRRRSLRTSWLLYELRRTVPTASVAPIHIIYANQVPINLRKFRARPGAAIEVQSA